MHKTRSIINPYLITLLTGVFILLSLSQTVGAENILADNTGAVLKISGKISHTNKKDGLYLGRAQLKALPQTTLSVTTPWTDGTVRFTGPKLIDVLNLAGADGKTLTAIAHNDYQTKIPVQDAVDYPVIIAMDKNGKPMNTRELGPLWIIYPWGDIQSLRNDKYYARSIWQLTTIIVHE